MLTIAQYRIECSTTIILVSTNQLRVHAYDRDDVTIQSLVLFSRIAASAAAARERQPDKTRAAALLYITFFFNSSLSDPIQPR